MPPGKMINTVSDQWSVYIYRRTHATAQITRINKVTRKFKQQNLLSANCYLNPPLVIPTAVVSNETLLTNEASVVTVHRTGMTANHRFA